MNAKTFERFRKLLENQVHTVFDGLRVFGVRVGQRTLEIVEHGQNGRHRFFAAVQNEFSLLLERAFLVVFKLCDRAQKLVFQLGNLVESHVERVFLAVSFSRFLACFLVDFHRVFLCQTFFFGRIFGSLSLVQLLVAVFDRNIFLLVHSFL